MGLDAPSHWVILLIAAVVLFGGYKKLPEMTRSVGRSLRIFKTELKGMTDDDAARDAAAAPKAEASPAESAKLEAQVNPAPLSPQVPPSLGGDTNAGLQPPAVPAQPAAEAPREAPQQQT